MNRDATTVKVKENLCTVWTLMQSQLFGLEIVFESQLFSCFKILRDAYFPHVITFFAKFYSKLLNFFSFKVENNIALCQFLLPWALCRLMIITGFLQHFHHQIQWQLKGKENIKNKVLLNDMLTKEIPHLKRHFYLFGDALKYSPS